ncbi:hypothetical protein [Maridesulfovibrio sp.]|uniref:hypothetical protein n=1 Tax=Maridesulfovibrio sp. TaxID=2795000 RepID=UPI002A1887B3|nr:hypothetical protein [Maridesulfovibrio sp.]
MNSDDLCHHVSDMMSACAALRVLRNMFEQEDRYGEAFFVESIRKAVSDGANAFDEYDMKVQMAKKRSGKPAAVLELVRE